jgi:PTS system nitrogen regulatory IIA component
MRLTVRDVARLLSVSERTIYRWIEQGTLPAQRVNEQHRFSRAELLEWATARKMTVSAALFDDATDDERTSSGFAHALEAGGVIYGAGGTDTRAVLRAVVGQMQLPPKVDRGVLLRILLARETLQSTGIGDGIAIPHVRNPIVLRVPRATITLAFLATPVDFGALDGKPVDTLFLLVSPTVREHLRLLARLSFALHDAGFRSAVNRRTRAEEILAEARRVDATLAARDDGARRSARG